MNFWLPRIICILGEWENAMKELLPLACGAFVIAGLLSPGNNENALFRFLSKLIPYGTIFFALTIVSFGIDHFIYGKDAAGYVPAWIPDPVFWIYFAGAALLGSGIAIVLRVKTGLAAFLLGGMIFIWFIILHIPKVIAAPAADMEGELTSAHFWRWRIVGLRLWWRGWGKGWPGKEIG